jgi:REP element-mobilizing transposase RayT
MATQKREFVLGNYYHIYNRGNSKQNIFKDEGDKNRFTQLLFLCNGENSFKFDRISKKDLFNFTYEKGDTLVEICAWVLMSNHFHLLIYIPEGSENDCLSKFLAKLEAAYLKYFNKRHNRTGGLFEGRFQSVLVTGDKYLKYLYSYVHLNPLKSLDQNWKENKLRIKKANVYLDSYKFSSYIDLVNKQKRSENNILSQNSKVKEISAVANSLEKLFSLLE